MEKYETRLAPVMDPLSEYVSGEVTDWTMERRRMAEWLHDRLLEDLERKKSREEIVDRIESLLQDATMHERGEAIARALLHGHPDDAEAIEGLGSAYIAKKHIAGCQGCRDLYATRLAWSVTADEGALAAVEAATRHGTEEDKAIIALLSRLRAVKQERKNQSNK